MEYLVNNPNREKSNAIFQRIMRERNSPSSKGTQSKILPHKGSGMRLSAGKFNQGYTKASIVCGEIKTGSATSPKNRILYIPWL